MLSEKCGDVIKGNQVHPVVQVDVTGAWNHQQLLRLSGQPVSLFAEFDGVCIFAGNE
jgi:hypothetical protein